MRLRKLSKTMASMGLMSFAMGVIAQPLLSEAESGVAPVSVAAPSAATALPSAVAAPSLLSQLVERAITTHPEINARYHDFVSSLEEQNVARAGWRPQVTAQAWTGREWRSNIESSPSYDWGRHGWSLELRQLLFDGGATTNRIRQFGFEKLAKYYDLQATSNQLANEAVAAYLDVQRYRAMQSLAQENYSMHETTFNQLRERQESGVGRGVDMEQASGRLSLAQTNLMTESNNLSDVTQRFRRVIGEYPPADMPPAPEVQEGLPVIGQTQDFSDAMRANPAILSKQALVQAAQAGNKAAQAAHAPTLDLRAGTGRDRESPGIANRDVQSSRVQLMLTYPLYRGGADSARIRQTAAQVLISTQN